MPYATQADLVTRFGAVELQQISDHTNTGAIDAGVVSQALGDADNEINGYLAGRYALPLATVPAVLIGIACDIARYRLYDDRVTEQVTKRYDDAIKYLKAVATGAIGLGLDTGGEPPAESGGAQIEAEPRVFTRFTLKDFL